MKTVKQILEESQAIDYTDRLSVLSSLGLLEESKVGLVRRSLEKNPMNMTMAESKSLKEFVDNILSQILLEKQDYLSKFDKRVPKGYPSDRDMPTVLILKRKAIRVYPDNQKVALYYSQALDRYISIPFNGARGEPLGMVMNEETEQLNELYDMRRSEDAVKSKGPVQGPGTSYGMFGEGSVSDRFRSNVQMIHEEELNEALPALPALSAVAGIAGIAGRAVVGKALELGTKLGKKALDAYKKSRKNAERNRRKQERQTRRDRRRGNKRDIDLNIDTSDLPQDDEKKIDLEKIFTKTGGHETPFKGVDPKVTSPGIRATMDPTGTTQQLRAFGQMPGGFSSGTAGWQRESNLSIIRKLSRSKSLLEQKINFLDENDLTINRGAAKKIMKVYNSLNESNKGKMEKMLNESVVTFTQAINFAVRQ